VGGELYSSPAGGAAAALNVYVDSSVLLRVVLGEPGRLRIWSSITVAVASELITLECLRTIDRARIQLQLADEEIADRRAAVFEAIEGFNLVPVGPPVLERATEPFPTMLGSLDAIHLSSALLVRERFDDLSLATHDRELAVAARAVGFSVHGIPSRAR
jgi:predicted nucleic acid-binding protein